MSALFRVIKTGLRLSGFLSLTLVLGPLQFLVMLAAPRFWHVIPMLYHRGLIWMLGVTVRRHGAVPPAGALLASNHVSWFDIVAVGAQMPVSFVAKHEVKTWPLFGQLANLQRTIYINRARGRHTLDNRDTMKERLVAGGRLVLFAEGTTGDGSGAQPFKSALFSSVQRARDTDPKIVVHPMTISYTALGERVMTQTERDQYAWLGDAALVPHLLFTLGSPPFTVDIVFHDALPANVMHDRKAIARRAQDTVDAALIALTSGEMPQTVVPEAHVPADAMLDAAPESR